MRLSASFFARSRSTRRSPGRYCSEKISRTSFCRLGGVRSIFGSKMRRRFDMRPRIQHPPAFAEKPRFSKTGTIGMPTPAAVPSLRLPVPARAGRPRKALTKRALDNFGIPKPPQPRRAFHPAMKPYRFISLFSSVAVLSSTLAQTSRPPATAAPPGDVVELSAFEVTSARDKGYSARDTIGASRIAIPIAELSQSIAVVNEEMLRDLAANSLPEVTRYIGGVAETNSPGSDTFAIRGVPISSPFTDGMPEVGSSQGTAMDFAMFNRVEVLKGPSAVIYGLTTAGGVVNRVAKKPQFDRRRALLDLEIGSYDHYRATLDANQPLGRSPLAFRLVGTYWSRKSIQDFDYGHRRFLAPILAWRVTPQTNAVLTITD
ncbi:MAG: hypothetical protein FJ399_15820, partial [Verrucomicrobia bacterium]|nr:hypothetical protein [Verrucomicrobiota bacterium]